MEVPSDAHSPWIVLSGPPVYNLRLSQSGDKGLQLFYIRNIDDTIEAERVWKRTPNVLVALSFSCY